MVLRPPVEPMLAQAAEAIPPTRLAAGVAYEQKFDGHRALLFTPTVPGGPVLIQTRRGSLVQDRFPDLVAAALDQLPPGLVLDGELLVWDTEAGALSFEALQRRAAARARSAATLAACTPAYFLAFDVLQLDGVATMGLPYRERRRRLEVLCSARALTAPWTLCPMTTDLATAQDWLENWTDVSGVEGLVIKPLTSKYLPNTRGWTKVRRRDTTEAVIGAVTGTLTRPQLLILGRYDQDGRLRAVARTVPLRPDAARQVAERLTASASGHPWTGAVFSAAWGSRDVLDVTLVRPDLVAEVSADRAVDHGGIFRHPLRFQRLRPDVAPEDVPGFGAGAAAASG
ncbi:ATP-dependent DNA ligase [Streptomyces flavotricini]|uniref:ATP-dependent DNA ligase n=2 Tax=Streptomyces TaxID=1883 RepID=A0ABS8EHJ5_9ACTN|nr:ATP-dependent DNA ligase [Streptomyces flavotricini]MCC0100487.1 ATP-dependent DNA ligase [Streptomyces flavotricini]